MHASTSNNNKVTHTKIKNPTYNFVEEEKRLNDEWRAKGIYKYKGHDANKEDYIIDTPPPTLSGRMHLGHAFSYSQQDFIARFQRMRGKNVFYPFGTDDNGLPTERLVEKEKGVSSNSMKPKDFIDLCNTSIDQLKPDFIGDWLDIGMSCDFDGSYSTIDKHCITTSQKSFIDLYNKGFLYQEESPFSWCTTCRTAIAQAEFDDVEMDSFFSDIVFKIGDREIIVSTTRPELLPSCVCIFVHPQDQRYQDLIGQQALVPLMGFTVPIIADPKAKPEKGTGIVMCCTFGDKTDVEWWKEHRLPLRLSIGEDGRMNSNAGKYCGLKIRDARKAIVEDLKEAGLLIKQVRISHAVNTHERCGTEIEFLKTRQWFIRILDKKQELLDAGEQITWYPSHMRSRYNNWVENLSWDWCISRQRHFGVPFPVWFEKSTGKVIVASEDQLPCDPLNDTPLGYEGNPNDLIPELDVMDTWATSSITPQIICNWASQGAYPSQFRTQRSEPSEGESKLPYICNLRPQAHDIIRTWAFYTIAKSLLNNGSLPWKDIAISGHVLDARGNKMSKSKGNVISPHSLTAKYGADSLRFWSASSRLGEDLPYSEKELATGKKTLTKIWNACHLVKESTRDYTPTGEAPHYLCEMDKWLLCKMNSIIERSTEAFETYNYAAARHLTDELFWQIFCDNYLEIIKSRVRVSAGDGGGGGDHTRQCNNRLSAQYTLHTAINAILRLYAPIIPFITDSCYQTFFKDERHESIHQTGWPLLDTTPALRFFDTSIGDHVIEIIAAARKAKSTAGISLSAPLELLEITSPFDAAQLHGYAEDIRGVTHAEKLAFSSGSIVAATFVRK